MQAKGSLLKNYEVRGEGPWLCFCGSICCPGKLSLPKQRNTLPARASKVSYVLKGVVYILRDLH
jgi:hypothetical protein